MLQRLPIAFPQVQAGNGNTSSLYQEKKIIKKIYYNIMNSTKV